MNSSGALAAAEVIFQLLDSFSRFSLFLHRLWCRRPIEDNALWINDVKLKFFPVEKLLKKLFMLLSRGLVRLSNPEHGVVSVRISSIKG